MPYLLGKVCLRYLQYINLPPLNFTYLPSLNCLQLAKHKELVWLEVGTMYKASIKQVSYHKPPPEAYFVLITNHVVFMTTEKGQLVGGK